MKFLASFCSFPKKLEWHREWHKGYWSGVLVGVGSIMSLGGLTAMRYQIELDPGLIMAIGWLVFFIGIIVARQSMKSAGEDLHERQ